MSHQKGGAAWAAPLFAYETVQADNAIRYPPDIYAWVTMYSRTSTIFSSD